MIVKTWVIDQDHFFSVIGSSKIKTNTSEWPNSWEWPVRAPDPQVLDPRRVCKWRESLGEHVPPNNDNEVYSMINSLFATDG